MSGTNPEVVYTGSDRFNIVVHHYGDARGTKDQFAASNPGAIDALIDENYAAHTFASGTLAERLRAIRGRLAAAWEGESADQAAAIIDTLQSDAETIATNTRACGDSFAQFQRTWAELKSQAGSLYEGVMGSGLNEDNGTAHRIYKQFNDAMQQSMHAMPSRLVYHEPLQQSGRYDSLTPGGAPGGGAGGPGPGGGVGGYGGAGYAGGGSGPAAGHITDPGVVGAGFAGGYSAHGGAPGAVGPAGYATGGNGTTGYGPGGTGTLGGSEADGSVRGDGAAPGSAENTGAGHFAPGSAGPGPVDLSSTLAGYDPPVGAGPAATGGIFGNAGADGGVGEAGGIGGIGAFGTTGGANAAETTRRSGGSMSSTGLAGAGSGAAETGARSAAAGAAAENGGRGMMMPMRGAGTDDEDERSRATWLCEDDDIFGGGDAPPGVIA